MKKYFYYLVFVTILFMNPLIINAECTYGEKVRLQKIAGNINFSYDFEEKVSNGEVTGIEFFITIANMHPDIYIKDILNNTFYYYNANSAIVRNGDYMNGITAVFNIYSNTENCKNELIYIKYVNLPYYNRYYTDEVCKGVEGYELCQRWQNTGLTYSQFVKKVNEYKKSLIVDEEPNNPNEDNKEFDFEYIYQFFSKYYFIILVTIIVVCLSAIFYINKRNSFDLK
ncbi:MAG: hypothetical protein ACM3O4_01880 [Ignavibacteriales bacterium]